MKRIIQKINFLLLCLLTSMTISCNKDDESFELFDSNAIIGTWFESYSTYDIPSGYEFRSDGTGSDFYNTSKYKFKWTLVNNILSIMYEENTLYDVSLEILNIYSDRIEVIDTKAKSSRTLYSYNRTGSGSSGGGNTSSGVPSSLSGKTLNLYQSDGSYWMGIYHSTGGKASVNLYNNATIAASYPPTYSYKVSGNTSTYSMTFVTQTYVPFYGTNTYSQFTEDITLKFGTSSTGTYSGKQTNMTGGTKSISGSFKIM